MDDVTREMEQLAEYVDAMHETPHAEEAAVMAHLAWNHCVTQLVPAIAAERYRAVIELRREGLMLHQIAELLNVTPPRVSQMIRKGGGADAPSDEQPGAGT